MGYFRSPYFNASSRIGQVTFITRTASDLLASAAASPAIALINATLLFLFATLQQHFPGVAHRAISTLVVLWAFGVFLQLRNYRLPLLCLLAVFLGFAYFVEYTNFGPRNIMRSWLILSGLILAIELIVVGVMRSLPQFFQTIFSAIYYAALSGALLGIFCYNLSFNVPISKLTTQALLQTTMFETREFLSIYVDFRIIVLVAIYLTIIIAFNVAQHRVTNPHVPLRAVAAIAIVALAQFIYVYKPTDLYSATVGSVSTYYDELVQMRKIAAARFKALPSIAAHKNTKGETYVLVIGESQNKDHMSLYGYERQTTPWLDDQIRSSNWIRFTHAFSNHTHTVPTLSLALTSASQYNGKAYYGSPSILDVAKAAGFRTYWLSNQVGLGGWDNPISAIAETADIYIKINSHIGLTTDTNYFDSKLVETFHQLKSQINNTDNNLIVFHIMGSHLDYCNRFPSSFAKFNGEPPFVQVNVPANAESERNKTVDCYDDSIAFTDFVLSQIFAEAKQLPGLRAFVYLPDHADAVDAGLGHDADQFSFAMTHISLIVWLSDALMISEPVRAKALRDHQNSIWTNDLLYDLVVGLTGVDVKDYDPGYDLSSSSYSLNWNSARTLHGDRKIMDDPQFSRGGIQTSSVH
ncbi:phosphoethanolamine transferase [Hyphomicrobium sp. 99]|uniref:phosphoethanolamine transferase n=1 Tax=Hyphomicrobium sp. 99 TaxID=1163419 RepID=UPI0009E36144|nr:phosphoethanolamine transferase [Hyphomicrobium sp. 99]